MFSKRQIFEVISKIFCFSGKQQFRQGRAMAGRGRNGRGEDSGRGRGRSSDRGGRGLYLIFCQRMLLLF